MRDAATKQVESDIAVEFDLKDIQIGEDGQGILKVVSKSTENRTISVYIHGFLVRYNGVRVRSLFNTEGEGLLIRSGESTQFNVIVQEEYYEGSVFDKIMVQCYTYVKIHETGESYTCIDNAYFITAPPMLSLPTTVTTDQSFDVKVNYVNSLRKTALTNLTLELAPIRGALMAHEKVLVDTLPPGESVEGIISLSFSNPGNYELDFALSCNQLGSNPISFEIDAL